MFTISDLNPTLVNVLSDFAFSLITWCLGVAFRHYHAGWFQQQIRTGQGVSPIYLGPVPLFENRFILWQEIRRRWVAILFVLSVFVAAAVHPLADFGLKFESRTKKGAAYPSASFREPLQDIAENETTVPTLIEILGSQFNGYFVDYTNNVNRTPFENMAYQVIAGTSPLLHVTELGAPEKYTIPSLRNRSGAFFQSSSDNEDILTLTEGGDLICSTEEYEGPFDNTRTSPSHLLKTSTKSGRCTLKPPRAGQVAVNGPGIKSISLLRSVNCFNGTGGFYDTRLACDVAFTPSLTGWQSSSSVKLVGMESSSDITLHGGLVNPLYSNPSRTMFRNSNGTVSPTTFFETNMYVVASAETCDRFTFYDSTPASDETNCVLNIYLHCIDSEDAQELNYDILPHETDPTWVGWMCFVAGGVDVFEMSRTALGEHELRFYLGLQRFPRDNTVIQIMMHARVLLASTMLNMDVVEKVGLDDVVVAELTWMYVFAGLLAVSSVLFLYFLGELLNSESFMGTVHNSNNKITKVPQPRSVWHGYQIGRADGQSEVAIERSSLDDFLSAIQPEKENKCKVVFDLETGVNDHFGLWMKGALPKTKCISANSSHSLDSQKSAHTGSPLKIPIASPSDSSDVSVTSSRAGHSGSVDPPMNTKDSSSLSPTLINIPSLFGPLPTAVSAGHLTCASDSEEDTNGDIGSVVSA